MALTLAFTLVAGGLVVLPPTVALAGQVPGEPPAGPPPAVATIQTRAQAQSPVAPGARAILTVSLANLGRAEQRDPEDLTKVEVPGADAKAPVTFTVSGLPAHVRVADTTPSDGRHAWSCTDAADGEVCTLVDPTTDAPVPLLGADTAGADVELIVDPDAVIGANLPVTVKAGVGASDPAADLTKAEAIAAFGPLGTDRSGSLQVRSTVEQAVQQNQRGGGTITVRNLGPTAIGGAGAPVALERVVAGAVLQPTGTGSGWTCAGAPLSCRWEGPSIPVGGSLPPLDVSFVAPSRPTGDAPYQYVTTASAVIAQSVSLGSTPLAVGDHESGLVVTERPAPTVSVTVQVPDVEKVLPGGTKVVSSGAVVEAPGSVRTRVLVSGSSIDEPQQRIVVTATPPAGFTFDPVAPSADNANARWSCPRPDDGAPVVCTRTGVLEAGHNSILDLGWEVAPTAKTGRAVVRVAASVAGEPEEDANTLDERADNRAAATYQVSGRPAVALRPRIWHYPASRATRADGGVLRVATGVTGRFGIDGVNDGSSPLPAGSTVKLSVRLPRSSVTPSTDRGTPAWRCRTTDEDHPASTLLTCTLVLVDDLPINASLPRVLVWAKLPSSAAVGLARWPVRITGTTAGHAIPTATATKAVTVVRTPPKVAKPTVSLTLRRAPRREGRIGSVRVSLGNVGNAPTAGTAVTLTVPRGVHPVAPYATGCLPAPRSMAPASVVCLFRAGLQPGAVSSRIVYLRADRSARLDGAGVAAVRTRSTNPPTARIRLIVLRQLVARAEATPAAITSPAPDQPAAPVVLDGRSSTADHATATWQQVPAPGEPIVRFLDVPPGTGRVDDLTARFATPVVKSPKLLHFRLIVSDSTTTSKDDVTVPVDPVPVTLVDTPVSVGWGAPGKAPVPPVDTFSDIYGKRERAGSWADRSVAKAGPDGLTWDVRESATITRWNDVGVPGAFVWGSRFQADPAQVSVTPNDIGHTLPSWTIANARFSPVTETPNGYLVESAPEVYQVFDVEYWYGDVKPANPSVEHLSVLLGQVRFIDATPEPLFSGPDWTGTISGTLAVGNTLTANPPPWTIQTSEDYQWYRCTMANACTVVPGATGKTYLVTDADRGTRPAFTMTPHGLPEGEKGHDYPPDPANIVRYTYAGPALPDPLQVRLPVSSINLANGASRTITATTQGGSGAATLEWSVKDNPLEIEASFDGASITVTAPASGEGSATFLVTATTADETKTAELTVHFPASTVQPPIYCSLVTAAAQPGARTGFALGSTMQLSYQSAALSAGGVACTANPTVTIHGAAITLFGGITLRADTVTVGYSDNAYRIGFEGVTVVLGTGAVGAAQTITGTADLGIVLSDTDGAGTELALTGTVDATGFPFVDLTRNGWLLSQRLTFALGSGSHSVTYQAKAYRQPTTPFTGSTFLDVPPNVPFVTLGGTLAATKANDAWDVTFDATLAAEFQLIEGNAASTLTFAGEASYQVPDGKTAKELHVTATAALAGPLEVGPGVSLRDISLTLGTDGFRGTGTVAIASPAGSQSFTGAFAFKSPDDWSASVSMDLEEWTLGSSFTAKDLKVTGTVARATNADDEGKPYVTASLTASGGTISFGSAATFTDVSVSASACTGACPKDKVDQIGFSGTLALVLPTGSTAILTAKGNFDVTNESFSIEASANPKDGQSIVLLPDVLAVKTFSVSLTIAKEEAPGATKADEPPASTTKVTFDLHAALLLPTIFSDPTGKRLEAEVTVHFEPDGAFVQASLRNWLPFPGAPTFESVDLVYTQAERTVRIGPAGTDEITVPANTVYLASHIAPPTWLKDVFGKGAKDPSVLVTGALHLDDGTFEFNLTIDLGKVSLGKAPVEMTLDTIELGMAYTGSSLRFTVAAEATLTLPAADTEAPPKALEFRLAATVDVASATFSGSLTLKQWDDAFGVTGLQVTNLTVSVSIGLRTGSVVFGLGGTVVLPDEWGEKVGLAPGAPVTLVAAIDVTSAVGSCIGFEIGEKGSTQNVLDLGGTGGVTAKHASFYLAPTGCTVGPFEIPAGFSMDFDGAVMGVPVHVSASVSTDPFAVKADLTVGTFTVAGFTMERAALHVDISATSQAVSFAAAGTIADTHFSLKGEFSSGSDGVDLSLAGTLEDADLGGLKVVLLEASLVVKIGAGAPTIEAKLFAKVSLLSSYLEVRGDLSIVNGEFKGAKLVAEHVDISTADGSLQLVGSGRIELKPDAFPTVALDGVLKAKGNQLASAHLLLQPNGIEVGATLDLPGVFVTPPSINGVIAWDGGTDDTPALKILDDDGKLVDAKAGDFRFDVRGASIGVSGFTLDASVTIGKVGTTTWATIDASLRLAIDTTDLQLHLDGDLDGSGDVKLTGSGDLEVAGIPVADADFTVEKVDGVLQLSATAELHTAIGNGVVAGTFSRTGDGTFFDLTSDADVKISELAGVKMSFTGNGRFHVYRKDLGNGQIGQGLEFDGAVAVAGVAGNAHVVLSSEGAVVFNGDLTIGGDARSLGALLGYPTASVRFSSTKVNGVRVTSFWVHANVRNAFKIPNSFTLDGRYDSATGGYDFSAAISFGPWYWSQDIWLCTAWAGAAGAGSLHIAGVGSTVSTFAIAASGWAGAGCGSLRIGVGASIAFWYTNPPSVVHGWVRLRLDFWLFVVEPVVFSV